jgi:hypothetical protein
MLEARPCVAGLRRTTRSDCRRAATHSAPSFIAALPHFQIATLLKKASFKEKATLAWLFNFE